MEVIIDEFIPVPFFLFDQKLFQKTFEVFEETTVTMTQTFRPLAPRCIVAHSRPKNCTFFTIWSVIRDDQEGTYTSLDAP